MLAHRLRRWPNFNLALDERLVFSGTVLETDLGTDWRGTILRYMLHTTGSFILAYISAKI